jgi:hypothetical protein
MYTTGVFRSQIYAPLLPDRHSSSYGSPFLIQQVYNPSGLSRSLGGSTPCCVQAAFRWRFAGSYTTASMGQPERDSAGREPAGKAQLDRDQLYRTRQVLNRKGFLMSIGISSLPR